ncbi:hypothetical protein B0T24DRAFT_3872 [Lasiosphaeria ovina]|uniref:Uncharacterized protein n=1 Tax=Lasiosphaeria ovina TaxID=92902 RepID=A0AAE0NIN0_9PEZI|nr:hypothetical protein B0T24DRAFT_3872 [Lasiosphaeria ovina]
MHSSLHSRARRGSRLSSDLIGPPRCFSSNTCPDKLPAAAWLRQRRCASLAWVLLPQKPAPTRLKHGDLRRGGCSQPQQSPRWRRAGPRGLGGRYWAGAARSAVSAPNAKPQDCAMPSYRIVAEYPRFLPGPAVFSALLSLLWDEIGTRPCVFLLACLFPELSATRRIPRLSQDRYLVLAQTIESRSTDLLLPRASATMPSRPTSPEWAELPRRPDKERDCSPWLVWRLCRVALVVVALVLFLHTRPPLPAGLEHGAGKSLPEISHQGQMHRRLTPPAQIQALLSPTSMPASRRTRTRAPSRCPWHASRSAADDARRIAPRRAIRASTGRCTADGHHMGLGRTSSRSTL